MIKPLDFTKYEVPDFPHFYTENQEQAIAEWHQINDLVTEVFTMNNCPKCKTELQNAAGIGDFCANPNCDVIDNIDNLVPLWQLTGDKSYSERYNMYTRESVVQECIDVIMNSGDRHRKEYFAGLLKEHFGVK